LKILIQVNLSKKIELLAKIAILNGSASIKFISWYKTLTILKAVKSGLFINTISF